MGFYDMRPELLLLVAENLSLGDLSSFRSTCHWVWDVLTSRFQKLCLKNRGRLTILQWAALRGYAELIELAILHGVKIDVPLMDPLTLADLGERGKCYKNDHRHPCNLANNDEAYYDDGNTTRRTPLYLAACCGHADAIEVLLNRGASTQSPVGTITPAHIAASQGNVACMQTFIHHGFDINATGFRDNTILHHAILTGGIEMMKYILQLKGGQNLVNARSRGGLTPLHKLACSEIDLDCQWLKTDLLLQYGADIYAWDDWGYTPAHQFAAWGMFDCVQVLIDAGFDLQTRAKCGRTILHSAIYGGEKMVLDLLELEAGMSIINAEDNDGLTALDNAVTYHRETIVDLLSHHHAQRGSRKKTV